MIYLLSKPNVVMTMTDTSSDSGSDFELPNISFNSKRSSSSTATETIASTSMDFSNSLDVSTQQYNMTSTFQDDITDTSSLHGSSSHLIFKDSKDIVSPSQFADTCASSALSQTSPIYQTLGTLTTSLDRSDTSHSLDISPPATTFVMAGTPSVEMRTDKNLLRQATNSLFLPLWAH